MDKAFLIQLTQNIYKLTALFPKKEPLRYKMREVADEVLEAFILGVDYADSLEILDSFFEIVKVQNWLSLQELLKVQEEYSKLMDYLMVSESLEKEKKMDLKQDIVEPFQNRQERILELLKEKGGVQVWQMKKVFPEISKRTLRRDFENLLRQGLIERIGERNDTFYQIKTTTA